MSTPATPTYNFQKIQRALEAEAKRTIDRAKDLHQEAEHAFNQGQDTKVESCYEEMGRLLTYLKLVKGDTKKVTKLLGDLDDWCLYIKKETVTGLRKQP